LLAWKKIFVEGWNSIDIHQSYSNGLLKWAYELCFGFCIHIQMHFLLWFHLIVFYWDSIHDTWWKKKWIEQNYNKNFNQQITMDFWMTKFGPHFPKSLSWSFFVGLIFFPLTCMLKNCVDGKTFHMDFISWLITTYGPSKIDI
jgi:hypothetical protein